MPDIAERIADNVARIRQSIAAAAARSGRDPDDVTLVAVTKYVDLPVIAAVVQAGCSHLGESRPQELWRKAEGLESTDVHWHLIGHLQRNKARRTVGLVELLHAGDSHRLLEAVDRLGQEQGIVVPALLEVNISGDESKHGLTPEQVEPLLPDLARLSHLRIRGLMAMAAWGSVPDEARQDFANLRELRDRLQSNCPPEIQLDQLSMGMSGDYEAAIEEGATLVRVGSALYEGIER
jgi:pyridoxal phosphate enzyme (YggS family)